MQTASIDFAIVCFAIEIVYFIRLKLESHIWNLREIVNLLP